MSATASMRSTHWLCHPVMECLHPAGLQSRSCTRCLHSWSRTVLVVHSGLQHGGCGSVLLHSLRGRWDQFPQRGHHQGECVHVCGAMPELTEKLHVGKVRPVVCVFRWQRWTMTPVGSQQRFGGSEATCQRTTFPYFLTRNNILSISFFFNFVKQSDLGNWFVRSRRLTLVTPKHLAF